MFLVFLRSVSVRGDEASLTLRHLSKLGLPVGGPGWTHVQSGTDTIVRTGGGLPAWDLVQDNENIKGSKTYLQLNDARFLAEATQACEDWNNWEFFKTATANDVQHCLDV